MPRTPNALPGYQLICTGVGALYFLLGCSTLTQGRGAVLAPFGVPQVVLESAHVRLGKRALRGSQIAGPGGHRRRRQRLLRLPESQ